MQESEYLGTEIGRLAIADMVQKYACTFITVASSFHGNDESLSSFNW